MSLAIPAIQGEFGWSKAQLGAIGTVFFWIYGTGQLINGFIGDRFRSRLMIYSGLLVTALTNILFGFSTSLVAMLLLWGLNGYFQSMLWGPMTRTLSHWFSPEQRSRIAIRISTSIVGGYLLAWGLAGYLLARTSWPFAFWLPGVIVLLYSFIWYRWARSTPQEAGLGGADLSATEPTVSSNHDASVPPFRSAAKSTKLWLIVIACLAQGVIKDGIALWAPTLLLETQRLGLASAVNLVLVIPVMNFVGILVAGKLNQKLRHQDTLTAAVLMTLALLGVFGLMVGSNLGPYTTLLFLGFTSAMMYGTNTILLSVVPMGYARYNLVSSVAGFLDFSSYLAAGAAAAVTGLIVDKFGWQMVFIAWILISAIGILSAALHWYLQLQRLTNQADSQTRRSLA